MTRRFLRTSIVPLIIGATLLAVATVGAATITGTAGDDTLRGGAAADTLSGKGGNDKLYGAAGNDVIIGGRGNDLLVGGPGADEMSCGAGRDTARGDARDTIAADCEVVKGIPTRTARGLFSEWLAAFNSGNPARYARFLVSQFPSRAASLGPEMGLREFTGGFELRKLRGVSPTRVSGWLQERDSDQFVSFALRASRTKPQRILTLQLAPIARPAEFAIARLTEAEAISGLEALLGERAAADRFSGTALVAKGSRVLFAGAYGLADRERHISSTLQTRFRIGSMNKMFTAVAILQLVEAGKLELTAPIGRYLTDYPNRDVATRVTIHHLLTHTGGTGDIFGPLFERNRNTLREHSDYLKVYGDRGLDFAPGSYWVYSNYGFILLGAVIERVTGQSYYDYVQEHIYDRAGMTGSGSLPEEQIVPDRSIGYMKPLPGGRWQPNTDLLPYRGTSAGGGYSTVEDIARFAHALMNHELLGASSTELLTTGKVEAFPGLRYAYGFMDARDANGNGWVGHGGGFPGMNGDLRIYPKSGYVVVALANLDPPAAQRITDYLDPRLPTGN